MMRAIMAMLLPAPYVDSTTRIEDVDAMSATMADGLKCEYVQLEPGSFVAEWNVIRLPAMAVQFGCEQISVARRMRVPADRWAFVVPLAVPRSARWDGVAVHGGELIVSAPRSESYGFDPAGMSIAVVSISPAAMPEIAGAAIPFARHGESRVLRPEAVLLSALRDELVALQISASASSAARADVTAHEAVQRLSTCLVRCLCPPAQHDTPSVDGRSRVVRQAEEFFRSHVGEPISIAQLSAVARVSERSLRNAFHRVYTTSPKRYLRLWQLHQVHHALRTVEKSDVTVTDIATDHGFFELGRFAGEYKALFGEAPSKTLHRTRHRSDIRSAA
jgi:AraC family transcriptional regulator, ethanolamine operon transcriptional activator